MSARNCTDRAKRDSMGRGSLNRGRCSCHPPAWGMKKGLRRARRRFAKVVIRAELADA